MTHTTLVTGANGFVAGPLVRTLMATGDAVVGVDLAETSVHPMSAYHQCDLGDAASVTGLLSSIRPDRIVHLAAVSSVGQSWKHPAATFTHNTGIFLNLLEAVRTTGLSPRILSIGSSEEYGNAPPETMPLDENHPLLPVSPYAVARVAQEHLSSLYVRGFGLDIVMTRSFNQFGPGQRSDFFIPAMLEQIRCGQGRRETLHLHVGDLSIVRDFLDVRDAASAYALLIEKGKCGEVYNVCSGIGRSLASIVQDAAHMAGVDYETIVDTDRLRPTDNRVIIGNPEKLRTLGWTCHHAFEETLREMLHDSSRTDVDGL